MTIDKLSLRVTIYFPFFLPPSPPPLSFFIFSRFSYAPTISIRQLTKCVCVFYIHINLATHETHRTHTHTTNNTTFIVRGPNEWVAFVSTEIRAVRVNESRNERNLEEKTNTWKYPFLNPTEIGLCCNQFDRIKAEKSRAQNYPGYMKYINDCLNVFFCCRSPLKINWWLLFVVHFIEISPRLNSEKRETNKFENVLVWEKESSNSRRKKK